MVVSFLFVSGKGIIRELIGDVIKLCTDSKISHVAIQFEDCIVEAVAPKVCVSEVDAYTAEEIIYKLDFHVSDAKYLSMYSLAKAQVSKFYGLDDCIIGGLRDMLGLDVSFLDIVDTEDCSALGTLIARDLFKDLLLGDKCCEITPERLYEVLEVLPKEVL